MDLRLPSYGFKITLTFNFEQSIGLEEMGPLEMIFLLLLFFNLSNV